MYQEPDRKNINMSKKQIVDELHRSARKNFERRKYVMVGMNDTFQADLIEMIPFAKQNNDYRYILMVIDVFSKRAWARALKNKTGQEVTNAMSTIFNEKPKNIPKNIHTDDGKEFFNQHFQRLLKRYKINHYSTFTKMKASIVERLNRTIMNKLWRQFNLQGSHKWVSHIQRTIDSYNSSIHRTIKMRPIDVNAKNQHDLLRTVYKQNNILKLGEPHKFKLNDYVRISKFKTLFEKGYTPNWTTEIFRVIKIRPTNPVTYDICDLNNKTIKGSFYEYELQHTKKHEIYLIEKVLKKKDNKIFVKWLGFDDSHNSWINKKDFV